jgi:hypothetical protein
VESHCEVIGSTRSKLQFRAFGRNYRSYIVSAGITGNGVFGTVNPHTGAFQLLGPGEADGYFGLAAGRHGTLLSFTYTANLVAINPETGIPTVIGATGLDSCLIPLPTCTPKTAFSLGDF